MAFFPPKRGATGSARPKTTSKLPPPTASEDDEDTISSSTISLQLESTVTSSVRPENRQNTGKSLLEALILASTNPQYDDRLFIDLPIQYMKIPSSEHVENILCA